MARFRTVRVAAPLLLMVSLGGCAHFPHFASWAPIRPAVPTKDHLIDHHDGYYAAARSAIERRDYAAALDLLQTAQEGKSDDVRVLNAFGVVYDKLGRFDLSQRYYAQARALDPSSTILANNLAYSAVMQGRMAAPAPALASAPAATTRPVTFANASLPVEEPARPVVVRLGFAQVQTQAQASAVTLAALPRLTIADASGRKDGGESVRGRLSDLGWTTPASAMPRTAPVARTTIRYRSDRAQAAHALARTLPNGAQLIDCGATCDQFELVLGQDAKPAPAKPNAPLTLKGR
ncbi:LytR C-terminal domain-containing protein [Phenylobacterium montanum]|uniref:LytR C-terminal domain-containing protein n=1 Tax=Phenylobacterium montanum TaxID=2823693 RepID=A0A975IV32_9CAUL|nr:LytR C-terminal domain-containing protein [Caulobacter sp. S6]QUD88577.1 LytR C-terminal domain-containing protein [Caulobacter sp. S6]